jgi:thiol-disulfide isomerase/thioredoxin
MLNRRSLLVLPSSLWWAHGMSGAAPADKPALAGVTTGGERVSLPALRGTVVLVFMWSTRCPVCLDKLPELRRNLEGWAGKPFVILAVNHDKSAEEMLSYERALLRTGPARPQLKLLWRGGPDYNDSFGELPLNMPTTMVLDKQGALRKTIRGRVPAELWDDIAELVLG